MPTKEPVVSRSLLDGLRVSVPAPRAVSELDVIERLRVLIRSVAARCDAAAPAEVSDEVLVAFLDDGSTTPGEVTPVSPLRGACPGDVVLVQRRVAEVRSVHQVLHVSDEALLASTNHASLDDLLASLHAELKEERIDERWLEAQERVLDTLARRLSLSRDAALDVVAAHEALDGKRLRALSKDAAWSVPGSVAARVGWHAAVIDLVMRRASVRIGGVLTQRQGERRRARASSRHAPTSS
ncbi:MAG: hypothetical protein ACO1OB_09020 [Archangium sp.]